MEHAGLTERALALAALAHGAENQRRKYSQEPYLVHPIAVAGLVAEAGGDAEMIAAAYLHDTLEDTSLSRQSILKHTSQEVLELVEWLTDVSRPEDGNRAARKKLDRDHLAGAPPGAMTIKLADIIDNSRTIRLLDPSFWRKYQAESLALLEVLRGGDPGLWQRAEAAVSSS